MEAGADRHTGTQTRFGSVWADPVRTAAVVRAAAARHGAPLVEVSVEQLAVCAVAADAWATVYDSAVISSAHHRSSRAARSLAAILARASGHPSTVVELYADPVVDHRWLARAERYASWVSENGLDPAVVLKAAAEDLSAGDDPRLSVAVSALLATVDAYLL